MPRISRRKLNENVIEELKENFAFVVSALNNVKESEEFFEEFLTSEEKTMLLKRLMLHLMIHNEYKNSQINAVLGMSLESIRYHKLIYNSSGESYKKMIEKISRREKSKHFWNKVESILKPAELFVKSRSDMKSRAKLLSGEYD